MHFKRQNLNACPPGKSFYACGAPEGGFHGCCSVEACDGGCPDSSFSSSSSQLSSSSAFSSLASSSSSASPSSAGTIATVTATPLPSQASISITSTVTTPSSTSTMYNAGAIASVSSSTAGAKHSSKPSFVPILAGAVTGVVVLSILSILVWFCLRRRKRKNQVRESIARYGMPTKDYVLDRSLTPEAQLPNNSDVFAEFGGRHKSPAPASSRPTPLQRSVTNDSMKIHCPVDTPIPDPEKSSLTPPPVHEHPAYRPLPGESPEIPGYHLGQPIYSPPMMQHATYHISQLGQHPAIFSGSSTSPRQADFIIPKRTTEVKRQKSSPRAGGRSGPMDITPIIPHVPSGRSELEAEVPASYVSPITNNPPAMPDMRISTQYNPQHYFQYQNSTPTRSYTQVSTYSIPIGLGVNSPFSPTQYQNQHELQSHNQNNLNVISRTMSALSPQSPFQLDSQYQHHLNTTKPMSVEGIAELMEGKEKEIVSPVNLMSPERWSGATCAEEARTEMAKMKVGETPVSATGETPSDDFRTWESWAQR